MNRKIQLAALLLFGALIVTFAIRAGEKHTHCRECPLAIVHQNE